MSRTKPASKRMRKVESGWSCGLCERRRLAEADVCERCGGCKDSCCLVLVTPCVDCKGCPGAWDLADVQETSLMCRNECGRCAVCRCCLGI